MRITGVELRSVRHRLRTPLRSAHGSLAERRGWRIELSDSAGHVGRAEALPLPSAGTEDEPRCEATLAALRAALEAGPLDAKTVRETVQLAATSSPCAAAALDTAALDLEARRREVSVARLLVARPRPYVDVNALIGAASIAAVLAQAHAQRERGFATLKLKLAGPSLDAPEAWVRALRRELGPEVRIRLDANGGWTESRARRALDALAGLDVELVEQPVPARELEALARLSRASAVPLAADETLASAEGRRAFGAGELTPIGVFKLATLGGLRSALTLARAASERGARCLVTHALDGPLGTAAALQLAAAIGDPALAHGLDAAAELATPFPDELRPRASRLDLPPGPGLGSAD